MKFFSPAKINLFLWVKEKRKDGYHELETVMQTIDFGDEIEWNIHDRGQISIECNCPEVPLDSSNLVWKAIEFFFQEARISNPGISVRINKKIPVGAGLGGGSSNAIRMLVALNRHFNCPLSETQMGLIANALGSDTHFFLKGGTWLYRGRGEIPVQEIDAVPLVYLLIFPGINSSTKMVYSRFIFDLTKPGPDPSLLLLKLKQGSLKEIKNAIVNNLTDAFVGCYHDAEELFIKISGEEKKQVFVSGSGSALFCLFDKEQEAIKMKGELEKRLNKTIVIARTYQCS
ncbi:MAG: 4-(cytidine 5'-diphospho)-2-C-methyl-D-erythritol kinase [Candidatus Aureabacteria bacterium]|nr:4-(cytidine 5'-diphospho)-2-C-methyl-D-erythritol kinase [Candidatus Auribacterota bacterium]